MKLVNSAYQDKNLKFYLETNTENGVTYIPDFVIKKILAEPAADAKPIERCRDCKYHNKAWGVCNRFPTAFMKENDFCSKFERRENK